MLKRNARRALKGNWGRTSLIFLLYLGVMTAFTVFSVVVSRTFVAQPLGSNPTMQPGNWPQELLAVLPQVSVLQILSLIFSLLLLYPLQLGIASWNLSLVRGQVENFGGIFRFFEKPRRYGRSILFTIQIFLRSFFWGLLFLAIPTGVMSATIYFSGRFQVNADRRLAIYAGLGTVLSVALMIIAVLLFAVYMQKYFLTPYLLAADSNLTVRKAIRKSIALTKGYRFQLLWYQLSFIGWTLLSTALPPLLFYTWPYWNASMALFAQYLMETRGESSSPEDAVSNETREFQTAHSNGGGDVDNAAVTAVLPLLNPEPRPSSGGLDDRESPFPPSPSAGSTGEIAPPPRNTGPVWPDSPPRQEPPGGNSPY